MAKAGTAKRTVSFFRLVIEKAGGDVERLPQKDWQALLENLRDTSLTARTYEGPTRRLIGSVLSVDGEFALKLMEPRDENSWLEILKVAKRKEASGGADDAEAIDPTTLGQLVETTIIAFIDQNRFGMIRGSTSSPTHTALAEWLDHLDVGGSRLVADPKASLVAEPELSAKQRRKLNSSSGVSKASVRISTTRSEALAAVDSPLAPMVKQLRRDFGDLFVTITLSVPRGRANDKTRQDLKAETARLQAAAGSAEAVSATLVTYDAESRAHSEDVNFISQRITTQTLVPLTDDTGEPIRNASAVRAIYRAADEMRGELN